jgi:predicted P-loop ATPase
MIVLKGAQGIGKSRLASALGRQDLGWFSDTPVPFDDAKAATETTAGKWIVELGELSGLRKAEVEAVKRFISSQGDTVRQAFKRYPGTYLRQCVFIGTTNRDDYISDPTGNRRFWPIDLEPGRATLRREEYLTPDTVDQIWAEADEAYRQGEALYLPDELEAIATERQLEHTLTDERGAQVREYLDRLLPEAWYQRSAQDRILWLSHEDALEFGTVRRDRVCAMEIWVECMGRRASDLDRRNSQAITDIMLQLKDWYRGEGTMRIPGYGAPRGFHRKGV